VGFTLAVAILAGLFAARDAKAGASAGSDEKCAIIKLPLISVFSIAMSSLDFWTDVALCAKLLGSTDETRSAWLGLAMLGLLVFSGVLAAYVVVLEIVIPINTGRRHIFRAPQQQRSVDWVDWERWDQRRALNAVIIMFAFTNLEMLALLPWKKEALERKHSKKGYKGLPERWMLGRVIIVNLFCEALPQLGLQIAYLTGTDESSNELALLTLLISCLTILFFIVYFLLHFDKDDVEEVIVRTYTLRKERMSGFRLSRVSRQSTKQQTAQYPRIATPAATSTAPPKRFVVNGPNLTHMESRPSLDSPDADPSPRPPHPHVEIQSQYV